MAGRTGRSGRRRTPGKLYRFSVRFNPGRHSPDLAELLELLAMAGPQRAADILDRVAGGGIGAARQAASVEAVETEAFLRDFFGSGDEL